MMRLVFLCVILLQLLTGNGLFAQVQFTRVYGGGGYDSGAEVIQTVDNGYLVSGQSSSFSEDLSSQILLFKTDENGYVEWRKLYGDQFADKAESMVETSDGNLLIAGFSETIENSYQFYALKLTLAGDTIWTRKYGGSDWDFCKQVVALSDGGFGLFGQTYSKGAGEGDFYLVRLNSDGDTLWTKTYGGMADEFGESIALANDGGFFLAGHTESFGAGGKDMYVVRTNADGDTLWTQTFGGAEDDYCYAVATTADGGYILGGGTMNLSADKLDIILRKEEGTQQWVKTESHEGDAYVTDVLVETSTQNVTIAAIVAPGDNGARDGRILRYGADGVWNGVAKSHGSQEIDEVYDIKLTSDNGYVLVGKTEGYLNRFEDVWLVKTNNLGLTVGPELGVDEVIVGEESFAVFFAPNPAGSRTNFIIDGYSQIAKAHNQPLVLKIYDALGKMVYQKQVKSASQEINILGLSTGIHFYQMTSENEVLATGKFVKQ